MTSLTSPRFSTVKSKLRGSCAVITCTLMLGLNTPSNAQVNGTIFSKSPDVTITTDSPNLATNVLVTDPNSLIKWIPTVDSQTTSGNTTTFLNEGHSLNFSSSNAGNYTVVNQFTNSEGGSFANVVALHGNVTSSSEGNIWFQSSGGILIGQDAIFNVGSLLLTTHNIDDNAISTEGSTRFTSTAGPNGTAGINVEGEIRVGMGDEVNRTDAYYAIIAPRINIAATSTATVAGSVAYVAAEAATITISEEMFDIQVSSGSSVQDALVHSGSTIVAANSSNQNIYMVAMPKNDAITMLVGGNLGWNATTSSVASDGSIILSAGHNISGGSVDTGSSSKAGGEILFQTESGTRHFNGSITANATKNIAATVASGATLKMANDAVFSADQEVKFTVKGRLEMNQGEPYSGENPGAYPASLSLIARSAAGVGGNAEILVDGGTLQLGGDLHIETDIYANDYGEDEFETLSGGTSQLKVTGNGRILGNADGTSDIIMWADVYGEDVGQSQGGTARLIADNGTINLLANPAINPEGQPTSDQGRITLLANGGKAGRVEVRAANNGVIQAATLYANADGEAVQSSNSLTASDGIIFVANNGRLNFTDSIYADTGGNIGFHVSGTIDNAISAGRSINADAGGLIELRHSGRTGNINSLQTRTLRWKAGRTITSDVDSKISILSSSGEDDYYGEDIYYGEDHYYGGDNYYGEDIYYGEDDYSPHSALFAVENINLGHLQTASETWLQSEQGSVTVANLSGDSAIGAIAQSITLSGTSDLNLMHMEALNGNLTVTTTGLLTLSGGPETYNSIIAADDIVLTSSGIAGLSDYDSISEISAGGRLRLINANPANPMIIGGYEEYYGDDVTPPPAYRINNYELGYYFSGNDISFESPATSANSTPQIIIRDADFELRDGGRVSFVSGGDIRVEGSLYVSTYSGPLDLNLTAAKAIHIVANAYDGSNGEGGEGGDGYNGPGGYIFVANWGNPAASTLNLSAPRIFAATQAAYDDLASAVTLRQYELRLAQNDGVARGEFIAAATINVATDGGFFVQNVGQSTNPDDRNGVVFGQGGLNITSTNGSPMLVLNGYQVDETTIDYSSDLYGAAALAGVTINGRPAASARGFDRQSVMNGCQLVNAAICGLDALPDPTPTGTGLPPIQVITDNNDPTDPVGTKDEEEEELLSEERESSEMPESLIRTNYLVPRTGQPLLIDPVTGAANDDMWGPATP